MPILSVEKMKIIHERETWKKKQKKQKKTVKNKEDGSYNESVRVKWFCCAFK